jgi:FemAB-related protein (PEP-CTERM system-associated)
MKLKYIIEPFSNNVEAWNDYVYNHEWGTIYHLIQWKNAIENTFHWKAEYYIVEKEQHICGILPLFLIKGPLLGTRVFSIPYAVYGGILANDKEIELELLKFAQNYTQQHEAQYLELRYLYNPGFKLPKLDSHVTFRKRIEGGPEDILQSIPRKSRASVRKGYEKFNLTVQIDKDLDTLYRLYCLNKRKLGSPVYPKSFFKNLIEEFQKNSWIMTVYFKNIPVSSVIYFYFKDTCFPYFSGYNPKYLYTYANNVLYYELMKESMQRGYKNFDFGRSRVNSGPGAFKKNMGFEPIHLYYYYYLHCATEIPNISPTNSKFKPAIRIWKKLPLPLTRIIGPQVVKYVP